MNFLIDSGEYQDIESICTRRIDLQWKITTLRRQVAVFPSVGGMRSRDLTLRPDTWNLLGTSGNIFDSPRAVINSSSTPYQGMLHFWNQSATIGNPVRDSTGKLDARSEERNRETIPMPRVARKTSTTNSCSFFQNGHTHRNSSQETKIDQGHNSNADVCKKAVGCAFIWPVGISHYFLF